MGCCLLLAWVAVGFSTERFAELEPARIREIEALLPRQPAGFGRPCTDRAFWNSPATRLLGGTAMTDAEELIREAFPPWNDELYLEFSRTGTRPPGEKMLHVRRNWLAPLVVAECLEDRGRFLPRLNQILGEYAKEPCWTLPAHDWNLENFHRKQYFVDLEASAFAADLSEALYLLGDGLDPGVRRQILAALEDRVFAPIRHSLVTGEGTYWLGSKSNPVQNNWNAVCLAGVVGAARTVLADRHDRAMFVAAGEHYSAYFINSFLEDGYCDEGPGYWSFGFGRYAALREIMVAATGGRIDLFARRKIEAIALYGQRIQLMDSLVPPFADCRFGTRVDTNLISYCNQILSFGRPGCGSTLAIGQERLGTLLMTATPMVARRKHHATEPDLIGVRSFFDRAGVLVCRPAAGSSNNLSVAIKAGGNGSHSHNDIGSFVIAVDGQEMVGDPGGPHAYNNRVFGPERFTYKILNSFGHPVPVVAGQLQRDATKVRPTVLGTRFTSAQDEIRMDLRPAYAVPELKTLVRTLRYYRGGDGAVEIEDTVVFDRPAAFEVALPTFGDFTRLDERTVKFTSGGERILATIATPDGFELTSERVEELDAPVFVRLGVKLLKPVASATVKVTFRGAPH